MKLFLVILLLFSTNLFAQPYRSQHQYIKLQFSELMSTDGLFDKTNYVVYDEVGDTVQVYGVGWIDGEDTTGGINYSVIATDQWKYNTFYTVRVQWVKDRAGNLIAENNYAFTFLPMVDSSLVPTSIYVGSEGGYSIDTLQVDTVYASGQEDANHGPEKATDGVSYTTPGSNYAYNCWTSCCLADAGGQWFIAGFNQDHFIQDLIVSGTYYPGRSYGLDIQISQDNVTWEHITNISTTVNVEWTTIHIGRIAKFVKINFLANSTPTSDWAGLWEIKVLGY